MINIHKNEDTFPKNHPCIDCRVWIEYEGEKLYVWKVKAAAQPELYESGEDVTKKFDEEFESNVVGAFLTYLHGADRTPDNVEVVRIITEIVTWYGWSLDDAMEDKKIGISVIV